MARKFVGGLPLGAIIALCAILLVAPDAHSQVTRKKYVITGTVGLAGVTMQGFPTPTMTDDNGVYTVEVFYGWTGTVSPVKAGYTFEPRSKNYPKVTSSLNDENYVANIVTYTISGSAELPGVTMNGFVDEVITGPDGRYTATVSYGFTGTIVPEKTGYRFDPPSRPYDQLKTNMADQNYKSRELTFIISGSAGVEGVQMKGFPVNVVSDKQGNYRAEVKWNWSGTVTPTKEGHEFSPTERPYSDLTENQTNQDYTAKVFTYQISGTTGMSGVTMKGFPEEVVTDFNGYYTVTVPYGFTQKVTPDKPGYMFKPSYVDYSKVTTSFENQDYEGTIIMLTIAGNAGAPGVMMSGLPGDPVSDDKGLYNAKVEFGFSSTVTPTKDGYTFEPPSKPYSQLAQDRPKEDYKAEAITYKITGSTGMPQVSLQIKAEGQTTMTTVTSGADGFYTIPVPHNWSGTITPKKPGYTFNPESRQYSGVLFPQMAQDYIYAMEQRTLSGRIVDETGKPVADVIVLGEPGPVTAPSSADGQFVIQVNHGWTGKLTFQKDGYTFNPAVKSYQQVIQDVSNLMVTAKVKMWTIVDKIVYQDVSVIEPIAGVKVTAEPGNYTATTDNSGKYSISVPHGWTGQLTFFKEEFDIPPADFTNVTENIDKTAPPKPTPPPVDPRLTQKPVVIPPTKETLPPPPDTTKDSTQPSNELKISQAQQELTTLLAQVAAIRKAGGQVPPALSQAVNQKQQELYVLLGIAVPTPPTIDETSAKERGDQRPIIDDRGEIVPPLPTHNLLTVLANLAKAARVTIETDLTVKPEPVQIELRSLEGLTVPQALQKILASSKTYTFRELGERAYKVYKPLSNQYSGGELTSALQDLSASSGVQIIPDPNVQGIVNAEFTDASLEEALEMMLAGKPYEFKKMVNYYLVADRNPRGPGFPAISETRRIRINSMPATRALSLLHLSFIPFVQAEPPDPLDPNDRGHILTITAPVGIADRIQQDIKKFDLRKRQVLLDARVVVMERGNLLNLGVEWQFPTASLGGFKTSDPVEGFTNSFPWGLQIGYTTSRTFTDSLLAALNLLEETSQADIIANPKVVAMDGRQAEMRSIQEEWFMMTGNEAASIFGRAELQKIESGTVLTITPYIGDNNDITLEMAVEVSDSIPKGRGSDLPVVNRRTAKNAVTLQDGGTVAVGGLTENRSTIRKKEVPGISKIPLIGNLFRNKETDKASREVAVFVTAHLIPDITQTVKAFARPTDIAGAEEPAGNEFRQEMEAALAGQNK